MADSLYDRVVERLRSLEAVRHRAAIETINERIRETTKRQSSVDDLSMAALARRVYLVALNRGRVVKSAGGRRATGAITPKYDDVQDEMEEFRHKLRLPGIEPLLGHDHLVGNFCTHKVSASGPEAGGFLLLAALFVWYREIANEFKSDACQALIPSSESKLAYDIGAFIARRLKTEAAHYEEDDPFPDVRAARPDNKFDEVHFYFLQAPDDGDQLKAFYEKFRTPKNLKSGFGDDNAHLLIYRARRSNASELVKSYLVLGPAVDSARNAKERHHPTLHLYRAPSSTGGRMLATPGHAVPLDTGLFIVGGQRSEEVPQQRGPARDPGTPFRSLEVLYFPWKNIETSQVIAGLALTINNKGEPLITRICARPTLLQSDEDARIGAVGLAKLTTDLKADQDAERLLPLAEGNSDLEDIQRAYKQFGTLDELANQIALRCNNSSGGGWSVPPGFIKPDGTPLEALDIQLLIRKHFNGLASRGDEMFDPREHLRISPLTAIT